MEEDEDIEGNQFIKENPIIFKKYRVKLKIGEGCFGKVFLGQNITNNQLVAIKVEKRNILKPLLEEETYILYAIKDGLGIPKILSFGKTKNYCILVEPLLGKSLFDIFEENQYNFYLEDICLIGRQIIERIQWIHSKYILHRDIKPQNLLIGKDNPDIS